MERPEPSLLERLSAAEREALAALGAEVRVAPGEPLIREGEAGDAVYLLLEGEARVLRQGQPVATLAPGDCCGEMALFHDGVRTAEVRAASSLRLLRLPAAVLRRRVLEEDPAAVRFLQLVGARMVERLRAVDARLLEDPPAEVAAALSGLADLRRSLLTDWALTYHSLGRPGKLATVPSKPVGSAADLAVAYSPGVAEPCLAIRDDPERSYELTSRGHLVGVITNGTAVLGLGDIGPLASKPVMEGKAVLFKRFADLDSFDLEVSERDPARFADVVCAVAPTFGGINLEDIRAPECFWIERACQERLDIPVFHDDQHGTAIVAGAGLWNALELCGKSIDQVRVVFSGAGAAGFATAQHFLAMGVRRENLVLCDLRGVVYRGRGDGNYLDELAADTTARTLAEAVEGADVFVGVSAPGVLTPAMLRSMAPAPIVFALANPDPEIDYRLARETRPDAVVATGRSDHPNQVNNVLAFPYLFRGALDCRARAVLPQMRLAATRAIARLGRSPLPADRFGPEHVIPRPFDPRLLVEVSAAVAEAAAESGVARLPLDPEEHRRRLERLGAALA